MKKLLVILIILTVSFQGVCQQETTVDSLLKMGNRKVELGRISEAVELFIRARKVSDKNNNETEYFEASVSLANLYTLYSRTAEAKEIFAEINPKDLYGASGYLTTHSPANTPVSRETFI